MGVQPKGPAPLVSTYCLCIVKHRVSLDQARLDRSRMLRHSLFTGRACWNERNLVSIFNVVSVPQLQLWPMKP